MNEHALPARRSGAVSDEAASASATLRYWAFISYSHTDAAEAERLHKFLETYRTPKILVGANHPFGTIPEKLTPIFRDRQELAASSDLGRDIKESIADSRYLIVICSPSAAVSRWVDQEIRDFKRIHGEDRVFAAIVGGEPFAADPKEECFPPSLRQKIDKRGKPTGKPAEPIAADLRDSGDGWKLGTLKII
ncbi:MAG: toll/interleukin-1 receptor domain-containing protein, partial [Sphingomicrobium sp.]